jgi:signal transduction histidine kinase
MKLQAILIEDSDDDALLVEEALRDGGIDAAFARARSLAEFEALLDSEGSAWSFVVSDYSLPAYTVARGLAAVRERGLDLPFIVVSGRYGEEKAVETMRDGAQDYVPKDRLVRLAPAVDRELRDAEIRRQRRELERHIGVSEPLTLVGRLAASMVHELNNPLTFLSAGLSVLGERLAALSAQPGCDNEAMASATGLVDKLALGAERVGRIVADFRALGAVEAEPTQAVDVNPIVDGAMRVVLLEFRRRARLRFDPGPVPRCDLKPGKVKQALVCVLTHIAHNLPLTATEHGQAQAEVRVTSRVEPNGPVRLEVSLDRPVEKPVAAGHPPPPYELFLGRRLLAMVGGAVTTADLGQASVGGLLATIVLPTQAPLAAQP